MPLTDTAIRGVKPSENKVVKLSDGGGLQLWITPSGSKLWRLAYRFDAKQKKLSLGTYPDLGLAAARDKRAEAKRLLTAGLDPGQQKKLERLAQAATAAVTFKGVAAEYMDKLKREERAPATLEKVTWLLSLVPAALGERPISQITAAEVLAVLRPIERRGRLESAKRLRSTIGAVCRYAIATARAESDPTTALKGALISPKPQHRAAILDPILLGAFLRAVDAFDGQPETVAALKLLPMLFTRPSELRLAEWAEFDLDEALWTIPANRTKVRREHQVPLPRQAIDILRGLKEITGGGRLVFPGIRTKDRPISENTMNASMRRMGFSQEQVTGHGFRATFSTLANESGKWSPDAIERALGHQDRDPVRRAYARGAFWAERVQMGQWWADRLDTLRVGGEIVALARKAGA